MIKLSSLKPEDEIFVFDTLYSEKRPTLYPVRDFIKAYKERPEDFGRAFLAIHTFPNLDKDWIKEVLNDYLNDHAIESDEFYGGEDFTIDDLWDDETLPKIVKILRNMLFRSGYFLKTCDVIEIDYSELATAKPEPEPDPVPSRKEISKEKSRYRSLLADLAEAEIGLPKGKKTSTESELESCPFCGDKYPRILEYVPNFAGATWKLYRGECPECHALGPECRSKELAIETWNRSRTNDPD